MKPFFPRMNLLPLLLAVAFLPSAVRADEPPRAFPGAQGFAAFTPGGRGGAVLRVTTLAATGPGTLREALLAKGPRQVVFEVGGVIDLGSHRIKVVEPFVTIHGATAPAPGITIIRGGIDLETHDVILQHIAVRPGEAGHAKQSGWEPDGLSTVKGSQCIVDHCSFSWAIDENLSASGPRFEGETVDDWRAHASHHITFSNNLIAEGLSHSTHAKGEHSKGSLLHDNGTYLSIIGNLYASNMERNPLCKGGVHAVIANNWIFNPGKHAIHYSLVPSEWTGHEPVTGRLGIVGNVLEHGPNTPPGLTLFHIHYVSPVEFYLQDNLAFDREHQPVALTDLDAPAPTTARPPWPEGFVPMPAAQVKEFVARNCGARPWDRDPIDARIIRDALQGIGKIIDSETEAEGSPVRPATSVPFQLSEWNLDTLERKTR